MAPQMPNTEIAKGIRQWMMEQQQNTGPCEMKTLYAMTWGKGVGSVFTSQLVDRGLHQISSVDLPRHYTTFTSFIGDTFLVRSEYMTTSFDLFNRFYHPDKMLADSDVTGATTDTSMEGIRKLVLQGTTYDKRMTPYYGVNLTGQTGIGS